MHRRTAATLTEVLIAMFCMAVGMLSILAMFPLGIQNMIHSARDHRLSHAAENAKAIAEMERFDPSSGQRYNLRTDPLVIQKAMQAHSNPSLMLTPDDPSVPVWIDPVGLRDYGSNADPVGLVRDPMMTTIWQGMPRSSTQFAVGGGAQRWFALNDDVTFDHVGQPSPAGFVEREQKYSWSFVWRRPRFSDPMVADLTLVLFSSRASLSAPGGRPTGEVLLANGQGTAPVFTRGSAQAVVTWQGTAPAIKRNFIVLDATVGREPNTNRVLSNGYFYRVVDVSDPVDLGGGLMQQTLQLETPARETGYVGVSMLGVADVIELSDGRTPR